MESGEPLISWESAESSPGGSSLGCSLVSLAIGLSPLEFVGVAALMGR